MQHRQPHRRTTALCAAREFSHTLLRRIPGSSTPTGNTTQSEHGTGAEVYTVKLCRAMHDIGPKPQPTSPESRTRPTSSTKALEADYPNPLSLEPRTPDPEPCTLNPINTARLDQGAVDSHTPNPFPCTLNPRPRPPDPNPKP